MTTTVEAVERYIQSDLVLHEALARGFLNFRRAARWLIEAQEWETTEEAVVSALRRYDPEPTLDFEAVLHILSSSEIGGRTGLAIVSFPRVHENMDKLSSVSRAMHAKDSWAVLPDRKRVVLLVEAATVDRVVEAIGEEVVGEIHRDVVRLDLDLGDTGNAASGAIAVAINVLAHRGIEILSLYGALPSCSFIVHREQLTRVHEIFSDLTSRTGREFLIKPSR